jgi:hypothetical protein
MGDHEQRLEEILAEWDLDTDHKDVGTYSVDFSGVQNNVSLTSPYTVNTVNLSSLGQFPNAVFATSSTGIGSPWVQSPPMAGPKITLEGADADVEINGVSLWKTMQEIANRLNIMQTNPALEVEWKELRELGDQYRKLEQHILDKQATFDRIKAMPAPDVD